MEEYIKKIIAPKIQGDGGWIEFISYQNNELRVMLQGECSKCFVVQRCMDWLVNEIQRDLGMKVKIISVVKKPFFWDM
jgi:Fe-S cluster biogenesis protein NfuA